MIPQLSTVGDELVDDARRVLPVFDATRLGALRDLHGWDQADVADAVGITASALSQAENGATTPSATNLARLALIYSVEASAFAQRPQRTIALEPQFRHLRRTSKREQRKAEQFVYAIVDVATILRQEVDFPEPFKLSIPIDPDAPMGLVATDIEHAAEQTRAAFGIAPLEPLGSSVLEVIEKGGVTVVRDPETDADIDAYSAIVNDLPAVVLDGADGSVWDRDNFNLAHELGHLVMHQGTLHQPGTRGIEEQAHRFAAAFLGPWEALSEELPDDIDWQQYLLLKRRWGLSMAALVRRAKQLGKIDPGTYRRAMKQRSANGWQMVEPGADDLPLPEPSYLAKASELAQLNAETLARRAGLPAAVVERVVGRTRPSLLS